MASSQKAMLPSLAAMRSDCFNGCHAIDVMGDLYSTLEKEEEEEEENEEEGGRGQKRKLSTYRWPLIL